MREGLCLTDRFPGVRDCKSWISSSIGRGGFIPSGFSLRNGLECDEKTRLRGVEGGIKLIVLDPSEISSARNL